MEQTTILKGWVDSRHAAGHLWFDTEKEEDMGEYLQPALLIIGKQGAEPRVFTPEEITISNERLMKRVLLDVMQFNAAGQSIAILLAEKYGIKLL